MLLNSQETELLSKLNGTKVNSCFLLLGFYLPTSGSHMLKEELKIWLITHWKNKIGILFVFFKYIRFL